MKYLKILLEPIKLKGDPDDLPTLEADLYELVQAKIESESLAYEIVDEEDEDEES